MPLYAVVLSDLPCLGLFWRRDASSLITRNIFITSGNFWDVYVWWFFGDLWDPGAGSQRWFIASHLSVLSAPIPSSIACQHLPSRIRFAWSPPIMRRKFCFDLIPISSIKQWAWWKVPAMQEWSLQRRRSSHPRCLWGARPPCFRSLAPRLRGSQALWLWDFWGLTSLSLES